MRSILRHAAVLIAATLLAAPALAQENAVKAGVEAWEKGDYKGAMALVDKASAVADRTAEENSTINQVKTYVGAKSGDASIGGVAAVKTKLSNDYNAKNYAAVIADGDALQKASRYDEAAAAYQTAIEKKPDCSQEG